ATRDEHDQWQIEPSELHRVYPAAPAPASSHTDELIAELRARLEDMGRGALPSSANRRNAPSQPRALTRNGPCNSPSSQPSSRHDSAVRGDGCGRRGDRMNQQAAAIVIAGVLIAGAIMLTNRWTLISTPNSVRTDALLLNRWTGIVDECVPGSAVGTLHCGAPRWGARAQARAGHRR